MIFWNDKPVPERYIRDSRMEFSRTDGVRQNRTGLFTFQQMTTYEHLELGALDWHRYVRKKAEHMMAELIKPLILTSKPLVIQYLPEIEHKDDEFKELTLIWRIIIAYLYASDASMQGDLILTPNEAHKIVYGHDRRFELQFDYENRVFSISRKYPGFSERII